jgi:TolB-like protein/DNA-binding winged helix-turn-helix (wHTH) protein
MSDSETTTAVKADSEDLIIAGWIFHANAYQIERGGERIKLEPKATLVLAHLAQLAGQPVSREALLDAVWPGVIVSDEALTNVINKLRRAFGDERRHPRVIETIPKMGYRLIAEVRHPGTVDLEKGVSGNYVATDNPLPELHVRRNETASGRRSEIPPRSWWITAGIVLSLGLLFGLGLQFLYLTPPDSPAPSDRILWELPDKPSVAVLPFANLSHDPEQEYFADGMTEDLITDLSKISELYVISRNSVFAYKGLTPKPQDVAKQLGASFVLEGSVRKVEERVRINVDFIDASTGLSLWADRFDGSLDEVFKLQDKVARNIVSALAIKLTENEQVILERSSTSNVESLKHYFLGRAYYGSASKQENDLARKMYRRAINLDPDYAQAYAALALTYLDDSRRNWGARPQESIDQALKLAKRAIAVDQTVPQAHFVLGYVNLYANAQHDRAIEAAKTAIALDPNYADGYALLSSAYFFSGDHEKSLPLDRKAMRLNPASSFLYYMHLGRSYYFQGHYQQALEALQEATERNYNYIPNHLWLAATYSQLDQDGEAEWEIEQVQTLDPDFSIKNWIETRPYKNPLHQTQLLDGLHKAGLADTGD